MNTLHPSIDTPGRNGHARSADPRALLTRHPANPILHPRDFPGVNTVFNPGPARYRGKIILLVSCTTFGPRPGPAHGFRETRVAVSDDGVHFSMRDQPLVRHEALPDDVRGLGGVIDCRLTPIDDWFYFLTPQGAGHIGFAGCCTAMYRTRDFVEVEFVDIVALPFNRGSSLFPEKIAGYYWRLDRPGEGNQGGSIWISRSPDLIHWGHHRPLLAPGYAIWNVGKIGPTPPVRVDEGWLVIVHGVDTAPCDGPHYYIGAVLLDGDDPSIVRGKTQSYLLAPEMPYEANGQVDNVVFPCGALIDPHRDELLLYYGAADSCVGLARGSLSRVVQACLSNA